jgi:hypothetical protein
MSSPSRRMKERYDGSLKKLTMPNIRIETDSLGEVEVAANALMGAHLAIGSRGCIHGTSLE